MIGARRGDGQGPHAVRFFAGPERGDARLAGLFAPPFGVGYYAACAIGRVDPDAGIKPNAAYLIALFVGLVVVALVPWISIGFL